MGKWEPVFENMVIGDGEVEAGYTQKGRTTYISLKLTPNKTTVIGKNPKIFLPLREKKEVK